jgi:hypothetical protein
MSPRPLILFVVWAGCGPSLDIPSGAGPGHPDEDGSSIVLADASAQSSVVMSSVPLLLATAPDLQYLTALAVDGTYVYFTGGKTVPVSPDAPPGSDTIGVLRRVPVRGGAVQQLWTGQGIGYAVAPSPIGISFVTYDYASRGRTGTVRVLETDGRVRDLAQWQSHGSCIGLTSDDSSVFWSYSAGSSGEVHRTGSDGSAQTLAGDATCLGKLQVRGGDVFWLGGGSVLRVPTVGGSVTRIWSGSQANGLVALATTSRSADLMVADNDDLIAIDISTLTTRTIGSGYLGTTDLTFDGQVVYSTNASDGTVTALSIADGQKRNLARAQSQPAMIVTDGAALYWINAGSMSVMSLPK